MGVAVWLSRCEHLQTLSSGEMNADTRLRKISLANLSNFKNGGGASRSPRLRLTHLNINKYGRAEDGYAAVMDSPKAPVVHHIPIVLEDDFFSDSRDTECYADRLRSLKIRTDISGQKEAEAGSRGFENRIKDSSKRPTINVDTFHKPPKTVPKLSDPTSGSKIYIHREKFPEPTCPLHGWKRNHQNAAQCNKVTEAKARLRDSSRQNIGFGSLRVKKHSLDSKLSNTTETPFQRRWSLRVPESSSSQMILDDDSFKERKNMRRDDKSESTHDSFTAALNRESRVNKTSTSASLNNSHATKGFLNRDNIIQASPSNSGILKSPGKRRVSSSNRVDFLDNLQEKEIPCRQT